jgi:hypothetical protein
MSLN